MINLGWKNLVNLFIGENSKKRQMGVLMAIGLALLYKFNFITTDLFNTLWPLCLSWTGLAFYFRLNKLAKIVKKSK